ncbi:hypothetical protein SXCC_02129 [Gluconacetobacter sp. SXCC-1]|nr:hypothetical protein SXCC_02129 [Gluconacetobacter sp. SXCC-1]
MAIHRTLPSDGAGRACPFPDCGYIFRNRAAAGSVPFDRFSGGMFYVFY